MSNELSPRSNMSPADMELYGQDTGTSLDAAPISTGSRIPSLMLLQSLSPQVQQDDGGATNADIGKIMHSQSQEIFDEVIFNLITVAPLWVERSSAGNKAVIGLLADGEQNAAIVSARENANNPQGKIFGAVDLPNGNQAVEVFHVFGFRLAEEGLYEAGTFETVLLKIKLTGTSSLGAITDRLSAVASTLVDGVTLDAYNFSLRVKSGDYKLRNGIKTKILNFEGAVGNELAASLVPVQVDGAENPIRVEGRKFLELFKVQGQELLESFYSFGNDDEDEESDSVIA